jgi:hypothetical protein
MLMMTPALDVAGEASNRTMHANQSDFFICLSCKADDYADR